MTQAKSNHVPDTIKVQSDNGSLRLQFSTKYNPIFEGKRKHQGLAMKDTPENWQKAVAIAWRIEEDLQHPDWVKLFDPTFAKYGLKTKYAAELKLAAPIPEAEPEMTVGTMWEEYLIWKQPQLQPTTFRKQFCVTTANIVKGQFWNNKERRFIDTGKGLYYLPLSAMKSDLIPSIDASKDSLRKALAALSEAFTRLQSLGKTKLTVNPFVIVGGTTGNKTDMYSRHPADSNGLEKEWWDIPDAEDDATERDRRCFSKKDRDTILEAFYSHKNAAPRQLAPLVEFRFLTGCRSGEAFALRWRDCFRGKHNNNIVFSRSYDGDSKVTKNTKIGEFRIFSIYPKLNDLLLRIKPANAKPNDLVFSKLNGNSWDTGNVANIWAGIGRTYNGVKYLSIGIVTQLANDGLIDGYLPFYNCRHTFITLQAHAGTDLFLLATACGNSVEVIQRYYLGVDSTVKMTNI